MVALRKHHSSTRAPAGGEVITDFFDQMKSRSKGYASMEYSVTGYRPNDLVRSDYYFF